VIRGRHPGGTYVRLLTPELQQIQIGDDVIQLGAGVYDVENCQNGIRL
jgi:hypothetical protein